MTGTRYTSGQMKMALASQLADAGFNAKVALAISMDAVDAKRVPDRWRGFLGEEISAAIDGDLNDPKTWAKAVR